ncbi:epimerase [Capnocytophaga sp.]|uniref:epimerase n=1 Tax=Capnocytophaga sp. TaxID=44737 RepID=UPI0026DC33A7|nr:epimerase [Capnocytophaga sp.]MDO5105285.1 epimerase [Capnocytophaga sp.]
MKIGIIGCGWLGFRLAKQLSANNELFVTTTSVKKLTDFPSYFHSFLINFNDSSVKEWETLQNLDSIIISIPFGRQLAFNFLEQRLKNLQKFIKTFKKQLFFTGSVGIYPSVNTEIDENFPSSALQPNLLFVENFLKIAFPQINILRLGGLMGGNRVFSNYAVSDLHQMVNHVHYQDVCLAIEKMIVQNTTSKTYNIVAPQHPTKQEIINYQKNINIALTTNPSGKIVSSKKLENELDFTFSFPNPVYF